MSRKNIPSLTAKETLEILDKQWADINDIRKLACCGRDKAREVKKEINTTLAKEGYTIINKVPMEKVVEYLKININYLKKISK